MNGDGEDERARSGLGRKPECDSSFHERLTAIRDPAESSTAFAKRAGLSQSGFYRIEKGGEPGLRSLIAIAIAAGVRVEWLATGEGPMRAGEPGMTEKPRQPAALDEELHSLIVEGIGTVYREENARLPQRDLGRLAARIHNDVLTVCEDDDDPAARRAALRMALQQLRRDLRAPAKDGEGKRRA